jgi:hypothetical protein
LTYALCSLHRLLPSTVYSIENALGESLLWHLRYLCDLAKFTAGSMKDADHCSAAVITPLEYRIGDRQRNTMLDFLTPAS